MEPTFMKVLERGNKQRVSEQSKNDSVASLDYGYGISRRKESTSTYGHPEVQNSPGNTFNIHSLIKS
jgi:hypothetical protein